MIPRLDGSSEEDQDLIQQQVETAQEKEKPRGVITQIGEFLDQGGILTGVDTLLEKAAEATQGTVAGKIIQPIADVVPNDEQLREMTANIPVIGKPMTALEVGTYQGAMTAIGLTPAARLANQEATWDNRPAVLEDTDVLSEIIYQGAKILTPSLIWRRAGVPMTGSASMNLVESGIEAVSQDSADDLAFGRQVAGFFGRVYAEHTSEEEGAKLTQQLIEGDAAAVQPLLFAWAVANNYAINTLGEETFKLLGVAGKALMRNIANNGGNLDEIALALGADPDDIARALTDTKVPEYKVDAEPSEVLTPEVVNLQQKPTNGNINEPGFINKLLSEQNGTGLDLNDPSNFFFDWSKLADTKRVQMEISQAFFGKVAPEAGTVARSRMLRQTALFLSENRHLLEEDQRGFLMKLMDEGGFVFSDARLDRRAQSPQAIKEWDAKFLDYFEKYAKIDISTPEGLVGVAASRYLSEAAGQNLVTVAGQILKMKQSGQDPTDIIENVLIPNQRFLRAALTPLRKAKRDFYLLGEAQQSDFQRDLAILLGDLPEQSPKKGAGKDTGKYGLTVDGEKIRLDIMGSEFDIDSLEQLYGLSIQGNEKARELFDLAIMNMRFGDPEKVLSNLALTSDIVETALKSKEPFQRYFYNVVALGQLSTQTNAVGATVFRQSMEPLALALSGFNPLNRNVKPIDGLYGVGQIIGGLYHLKSSIRSGLRAVNTNVPASGKDRFSDSYSSNLKQELDDIRQMHAYQLGQMFKNNENPASIMASYMGMLGRELAYHPIMNSAVRLLMAGDESAKVTTAGQIAWGRAFVNLWERGEFNPRQMMAQIKLEEEKIFRGPAWKGDIIDAEVKAVADRVTLQESFDLSKESNPIERFFAAQAEANKYSIVQRIFNAFPRAAYRDIEQNYVENLGSSIGLGRFNKKIQAIRASNDPTQRLALDSQISLAQLTVAASGVATLMHNFGEGPASLFGYELPRVAITSDGLIIEGEEYDAQVSFEKFSPAAVFLSLMGNAMEAFVTGETSEENFIAQIQAFTVGIASDLINRNMLQGQQKFARTVNVGSETWADSAFGFLWEFVSPGVIGELADILQPYETVQDVRTYPGQQQLSKGAKVAFKNIQNPAIYDIYAKSKTEYPKPKVATLDPGSVSKTRQGMIASMFYPGRVTPTRYYDPVMKNMTKYGYSVNPEYLRRIHNVELTAPQQSQLSQEIQGKLYPALDAYFKSNDFKQHSKTFKYASKEFGRNSEEYKEAKNKIYNRLNKIHENVKRDAILESGLYNDPGIRQGLEEQQLMLDPQTGSLSPERQGMYAQAAKQDSQLAQQVRDILDIA